MRPPVPIPVNAYRRSSREGSDHDCQPCSALKRRPVRDLLDPGDNTEVVTMAALAGLPLGLPQDTLGAHGINDDRITTFMRGYLGGVGACALPEWDGSPGVVGESER